MDFARRQYTRFGTLDRAQLDIFEALAKLHTVPPNEVGFTSEDGESPMSLLEHAFQTAEKLRISCPEDDWLHLVGLIHSLGNLLAHSEFGPEPLWTITGESFPVGCRFSEHIQHHQLFYPNPDRRNRQHNSVNGIYVPGCGLHEVNFSWSAAEYLYLVLYLNATDLPAEAFYCIRYQRFDSMLKGAYKHLLAEEDVVWRPWLEELRDASVFEPDESILSRIRDGTQNQELCRYYQDLIEKYIGNRRLYW